MQTDTFMKVDMHEAKSQLSRLAELAWQGKPIVIAKAGKPYLDLIPHRGKGGKRQPGLLKGQLKMAADFDETSKALIADFDGG